MIGQRIRARLVKLYGECLGSKTFSDLEKLLSKWREPVESSLDRDVEPTDVGFTEKDSVLIAYGDHLQRANEAPLKTLSQWCTKYLKGILSTIHVLPFHPSTSYEGYAITDYRAVNDKMGGWEDLEELNDSFHLMMDLVLNHCSSQHPWFEQFLANKEPGRRYFTTMENPEEPWLKNVYRARNLPLLHPFQTTCGMKNVWTTYSPDLIDLNWAEPDVFLEFMEIIFDSVARGARIIRLDAFVYLWKKEGTNCINQAENHEFVRLFQDVLLWANAKRVKILPSITNVSQEENYAYFGKGEEARKADLIYHLPLSALLLYSLYKGDATVIRLWLAKLPKAPPNRAYLNLAASHDGIGLTWLKDLIPQEAIDELIEEAVEHGALLSSRKKTVEDEDRPWELNATYFSASSPKNEQNYEEHIARFLATQNVVLALRGVPALYLSLFVAGRNDYERAAEWHDNRAINRGRFSIDEWEKKIQDDKSVERQVLEKLTKMLSVRTSCTAFHPEGDQTIIDTGLKEVLAMVRQSPEGITEETVLCLTNFSNHKVTLPCSNLGEQFQATNMLFELLTDRSLRAEGQIELAPYEVLWLSKNH